MTMKDLTSKTFDEFISKGNSVIDFHADWCGPCKIMEPILKDTSERTEGVKFARVDVDKEGGLAERFQVMSIPTLIFFKGKDQVDRFTGVLNKDELAKRVKALSK